MSEWWTYRLSDFLMFSPRTWWRLVEGYNRELWPLHVGAVVFGLVLIWLARHGRGRTTLLLLAGAWAWIGWGFFHERYEEVHLAGRHLAITCGLQSALLVAAALTGKFVSRFEVSRPAMLLASMGVIAYPVVTALVGELARTEVAGLMPEPTALASLGLVFATQRGAWRRALLSLIPLGVLAFGWMTLWNLWSVSQ